MTPDLRLALDETVDGRAGERRARDWGRLLADLGTMGDDLFADLDGITVAGARTASLCPGWSVRDVVVHFVVGDELARRALQGENRLLRRPMTTRC